LSVLALAIVAWFNSPSYKVTLFLEVRSPQTLARKPLEVLKLSESVTLV